MSDGVNFNSKNTNIKRNDVSEALNTQNPSDLSEELLFNPSDCSVDSLYNPNKLNAHIFETFQQELNPQNLDVDIPLLPEDELVVSAKKVNERKLAQTLFNKFASQGEIFSSSSSLVKSIKKISPDNFQYIISTFNSSNLPLGKAILGSRFLSKEDKIHSIEHLINVASEAANNGQLRSDDVIPGLNDILNNLKNSKSGIISYSDILKTDVHFRKIASRQDTLTTPLPEKPNGLLDGSFKQGKVGDCWYLASLESIANTEAGKKILEDAISVDDNGNTIVTFAKLGKSYTITPRDLKCSNEMSSGDSDFRALEIAMDRYFFEKLPDGRADLNSNKVDVAFSLLLPSKPSSAVNFFRIDTALNTILKDPNKENIAIIAGTSDNNIRYNDGVLDEDGNRVKLIPSHAYSVKNFDNEFVYLINPHDSSKTLKIARRDFPNAFAAISYIDTTKTW